MMPGSGISIIRLEEKDRNPMSGSGNSIIVLIGKDFIVMGTDSRITDATYGSVVDDNKIKIKRIHGEIFGVDSGDAEFARMVFRDVSLARPESIEECARKVETTAADLAESYQSGCTTEFILVGWMDMGKKEGLRVYKVTSLPTCVTTEEVHEANFSGWGSRHMVRYLETDQRYPVTSDSSIEDAKELVRSAMQAARRGNYETDGPVRAVTLSQVDGVNFWGAKTTDPHPKAPYGPWIKDEFAPVEELYSQIN